MNDLCLCIVKTSERVFSIGVNNGEGMYYSEEGGGCFDLNRNTDVFEYVEISWRELRLRL